MARALESPILLGNWMGREREGRGSSPTRRKAVKKAPNRGTTRGGSLRILASSCVLEDESRAGKRGEMGKREAARARALQKRPRRGGGEKRGIVGAGVRLRQFEAEKRGGIGGGWLEEERADRRARPVCGREREREREGRGPVGPGPRGRKGARGGGGVWAKRPKEKKGGIPGSLYYLLLFFIPNFQIKF